MLKALSITKSYGGDVVLRAISFTLSPADRVGLVGPNGSGKSTLLRILAGDLPPDCGSVWVDPGDRVAYLPQYPLDELHLSVREAMLRATGEVGQLQQRMSELENSMVEARGESLDALLAEYADTRERFEQLGGYGLEARMDAVVEGLGLDVRDLTATVATLSGGNKTKLSLARLLLSQANILLLDEPTNYLDLPALLWLERYVQDSDRSYLIVSHDRRFLDRTVSTVLEIDPTEHALREYPGSYSDYAETKLRQRQKQLVAYLDQQAEIKRIEDDIRRTKEQAQSTERHTKSGMGADVQRRLAKKVAKKGKVRERRLEKQLASTEHIEKPRQSWGLHLADLGRDPIRDERVVLDIEGLSAGYADREILHGIKLVLRGRDRLALLGENGSGKSTLLRSIAGTLSYRGSIRLGPSIRPGYLSQEGEELPLDKTVLEVFRSRTEMYEDEARTYLHKFLFAGDETLKPVRALSYGQRSKLALAILILSGANFLVLDEPTSHMDMPALEAIERSLAQYEGPLLVVSHDRYFLERIGITRSEVMEEGTLHPVETLDAYESEITARDRMEA